MRERKAFTLVEMMVVTSVIIILIGLAITAYSKLVNTTAARGTATALHNAQSLLVEFEQTAGLPKLGYGGDGSLDPDFPYPGGFFSGDGTKGTVVNLPIGLSGLPRSVATGSVAVSTPGRFPGTLNVNNGNFDYALNTGNEGAVFNTAAVMMYIARLPQARPIISSLSSKNFLSYNNISGISFGNPPMDAPVLVDGWGNPIIYVPPGGLVVQIKGQGLFLVRTSGTISFSAPAPPLKSNDRPFWASAGPDGNFDLGDDNVYSFQQ